MLRSGVLDCTDKSKSSPSGVDNLSGLRKSPFWELFFFWNLFSSCHKWGDRNMKQRIPVNSITFKLVLKSMYASCSTGPFFADHYSHRFEKTQLKFRQEKWLPVKISCIIWNEICKKKKLIKNRNGIFCQKFLIFLKSLKSLNKNFY